MPFLGSQFRAALHWLLNHSTDGEKATPVNLFPLNTSWCLWEVSVGLSRTETLKKPALLAYPWNPACPCSAPAVTPWSSSRTLGP